MSCGGEHDKDCDEVLARLVFFVDHELEGPSGGSSRKSAVGA